MFSVHKVSVLCKSSFRWNCYLYELDICLSAMLKVVSLHLSRETFSVKLKQTGWFLKPAMHERPNRRRRRNGCLLNWQMTLPQLCLVRNSFSRKGSDSSLWYSWVLLTMQRKVMLPFGTFSLNYLFVHQTYKCKSPF